MAAIRYVTDLLAWQKAFDLGCKVFVLSKPWPIEERYALTDQVRRAARSVSSNICEAWAKRRYKAHFISKLTDADGELLETENWLRFACAHGYIDQNTFDIYHDLTREVGRLIGGIMQNPGPFLLRGDDE
ncbi:MAG: four helix bundle protein [Opitutaceae bacterium]|jgi:four helix bundle protein|nr:four helix bundle protein [Opitutaceae bacterium]